MTRGSRSPGSSSTVSAATATAASSSTRSRRSGFRLSASCRATKGRLARASSRPRPGGRDRVARRPHRGDRRLRRGACRLRPGAGDRKRSRLGRAAPARSRVSPPGQRVALARDAAFYFIYPHLVQGWRAAGAEIVAFSPLADEPPPADCDMCWLPGGYPELHGGRLAAGSAFSTGSAVSPKRGRPRRMRRLHGAGASLVDASGVFAPDGGTARCRDQLRQTPHDARLSRGAAHRRLRAWVKGGVCAATSSTTRRSRRPGATSPSLS